MLALDDGRLALAATDLTSHLACVHLTQQRIAIARGERTRPRPVDDPHAELVRPRGEVHEREQLERLSIECGGHVEVSTGYGGRSHIELQAAAEGAAIAMRDGAPLIFQGQFFDGRWQGRTDFLRRVPVASELGDHAYEVLDTKLRPARSTTPSSKAACESPCARSRPSAAWITSPTRTGTTAAEDFDPSNSSGPTAKATFPASPATRRRIQTRS